MRKSFGLLTLTLLTACSPTLLAQPSSAPLETEAFTNADFGIQARRSTPTKKRSKPSPSPTPVPSPTASPTPMPTPIPTPIPTPTAVPSGLTQIVNEILTLTNQERQKAGVAPLTLNALLNSAAQKHAENMALTGIFSHTIDNLQPWDRVSAEGYNWSTVGENIAYGYTTPAAVMTGWMNSSGHRANILNASFKELGVGYALNSSGRPYWVQVFASPR